MLIFADNKGKQEKGEVTMSRNDRGFWSERGSYTICQFKSVYIMVILWVRYIPYEGTSPHEYWRDMKTKELNPKLYFSA